MPTTRILSYRLTSTLVQGPRLWTSRREVTANCPLSLHVCPAGVSQEHITATAVMASLSADACLALFVVHCKHILLSSSKLSSSWQWCHRCSAFQASTYTPASTDTQGHWPAKSSLRENRYSSSCLGKHESVCYTVTVKHLRFGGKRAVTTPRAMALKQA